MDAPDLGARLSICQLRRRWRSVGGR